ncbi:hypothetical protein [Streptomyces coffeae]|uniref:Uncharacterized protein n=1 Tax=Streptomyces coffeae TaxID=621382 RepID=A0ABS1NJS9_9ACTN|nr:hypothetical protein [Streptomyces coffeae]MBL1100258.1 hypothetical protein [Streptomyces coffeae]
MALRTRLPRYGLYGLLLSWFGLTVAQQFKKRPRLLDAVDPANVTLPISTFFAPNPGSNDTHLLTRNRLADGSMSEWAEHAMTQARSSRHMVWHPGRRGEKALLDIVTDLTAVLREERRVEYVQMTVPYLSLLNFVTHQCAHVPNATQVQFLLVSSAGCDEDEEPTTLLASALHGIGPSAGTARR